MIISNEMKPRERPHCKTVGTALEPTHQGHNIKGKLKDKSSTTTKKTMGNVLSMVQSEIRLVKRMINESIIECLWESRLESKDICIYCQNITSTWKCFQCNYARYCSKECQRGDWNVHKHICDLSLKSSLTKTQMQKINFLGPLMLRSNGSYSDTNMINYLTKCIHEFTNDNKQ